MNLKTDQKTISPSLLAIFIFLGPFFVLLLTHLPADSRFFKFEHEGIILSIIGSISVISACWLIFPSKFGKFIFNLCIIGFLTISVNLLYQQASYCMLLIIFSIVSIYSVNKVKSSLFLKNNVPECTNISFYFQDFLIKMVLLAIFLWSLNLIKEPSPFSQLNINFLISMILMISVVFFFELHTGSYRKTVKFVTYSALFCLFFWMYNQHFMMESILDILWLPLIFILFAVFTSSKKAISNNKASFEVLFNHPEGSIILTFALFCTIGALLLYLPISSVNGHSMTLIDSIFTAVSAVCVTGLVVIDPGSELSSFGQATVLFLIQLGGLGIMSVSSLTLLLLGQRLSLQQEKAISNVLGQKSKGEILLSLFQVLRITFIIEVIGAIILIILFYQHGFTFSQALWQGIFTAISAFCNAGFALQSDSLVAFQDNGMILYSISLLIILGGISPAFVAAMIHRKKYSGNLPLQYKFVIFANIFFLLFGTFSILLIEWQGSLFELGFWDKFNNAWFQSVTTRTAGFYSISLENFNSATIFIMMALMFIGGSPGGTAGGIKITTFMVLWSTIVSTALGKEQVSAYHRRIPPNTIYKAATVVALSSLIGFSTLIGILMTQNISPILSLFEVVSALGTVGLSLGATSHLDYIGKILIMFCMFLGRVGSYSMLLYLAHRRKKEKWILAEEEIIVT